MFAAGYRSIVSDHFIGLGEKYPTLRANDHFPAIWRSGLIRLRWLEKSPHEAYRDPNNERYKNQS